MGMIVRGDIRGEQSWANIGEDSQGKHKDRAVRVNIRTG